MSVNWHPSMGPHPLGVRQAVEHACPECPLGQTRPLCPVCLGVGTVTADRLARWCREQDRQINQGR